MNSVTIRKYVVMVALFLVLVPASSWAEHRHHDAHVHGSATLDIALEGANIHAVLKSPAVDVIGFEHSPHNEKELYHVQKAMKQMKDGDALFLFSLAAKCKMVEVDTSTTMDVAIHHVEPAHECSHEHHHDAEHEEHDHGHVHHDEHHDHGVHSNVVAQYHFKCENPAKLNNVRVRFFDAYSSLHKIKLQLIGKDKQTGAELTPENSSVKF